MQKLKKTYKFAIKTALYITVSTTLLLGVFLFATGNLTLLILLFAVVCYFVSFFIIQYRAERFIYRRVKKIYDDLTLLESTSLTKKPITTDMATLTKEIDKYARDKKLEIESLKIREAYRKEFIGNVSHELKTPLFTVQGYLLTLIDGAINDKKIREKYLNRANKGVERLIYIVKDLDMITKFEAGDLRLNITTFDIVELIKSVFDLLEMKASKKKITLTFDIDYNKPILVNADFERIQQVITNLVVNSIKYGREKGTTEISIENLIKNGVNKEAYQSIGRDLLGKNPEKAKKLLTLAERSIAMKAKTKPKMDVSSEIKKFRESVRASYLKEKNMVETKNTGRADPIRNIFSEDSGAMTLLRNTDSSKVVFGERWPEFKKLLNHVVSMSKTRNRETFSLALRSAEVGAGVAVGAAFSSFGAGLFGAATILTAPILLYKLASRPSLVNKYIALDNQLEKAARTMSPEQIPEILISNVSKLLSELPEEDVLDIRQAVSDPNYNYGN